MTRNRYKNNSLIVLHIVVAIFFVVQNIVIANPILQKQTLAPDSGLDHPELEDSPTNSLHNYAPATLMLHSDLWLEEQDPIRKLELFETMQAVGVEKTLNKEYDSVSFGSGMANIRTIYATLFSAILEEENDENVEPKEAVVIQPCYGCTQNLLDELDAAGVTIVHFIRDTDPDTMAEKLREKINQNTSFVYFETPVNPTIKLVDIETVIKEVRKKEKALNKKIYTILDNTFATSLAQKPIDMGIDMVLQVLTKGETGTGNVLAGVVIAEKGLADKIREIRDDTSEPIHIDDAITSVTYGIPYLHLRLQKQTENTKAIYGLLREELSSGEASLLNTISFPGEGTDDEKALYKQQMTYQGHMIYFEFKTDELAEHFISLTRYFRMFEHAVSLGQIRTLVERPTIGTHAAITKTTQEAGGIKGSGIRMSVGIEEGKDLIRELKAIFNILRTYTNHADLNLNDIPYQTLDKLLMAKDHEGKYLIRNWPNTPLDTEIYNTMDEFSQQIVDSIQEATNINQYQPINLIIHHTWLWGLYTGYHRAVTASAGEHTSRRFVDAAECLAAFSSFFDLAKEDPTRIPRGLRDIYPRLGSELSATIEILFAFLEDSIESTLNFDRVSTSFASLNDALWTLLHKRIEYINIKRRIEFLETDSDPKYDALRKAYREGGYINFSFTLNDMRSRDPDISRDLLIKAQKAFPEDKKQILIIAPEHSPVSRFSERLKQMYKHSRVSIKIIHNAEELDFDQKGLDLVFIDSLRMPYLALDNYMDQIKTKSPKTLIGISTTPNISYTSKPKADFVLNVLHDGEEDKGAILSYDREQGENKTWFDIGFGRKNSAHTSRDKNTILHILYNLPNLAIRTAKMAANAYLITELMFNYLEKSVNFITHQDPSHLIFFDVANDTVADTFAKAIEESLIIDFNKPLHRDQTTVQRSPSNRKKFVLSIGIEDQNDLLAELKLIFDSLEQLLEIRDTEIASSI